MNNMLPTPYQQFIHKSRYARWIDGEERRENWDETVDRYIDFMQSQVEDKCNVRVDLGEVREAVLSLQVMPSMRATMTSGPALARAFHRRCKTCEFALTATATLQPSAALKRTIVISIGATRFGVLGRARLVTQLRMCGRLPQSDNGVHNAKFRAIQIRRGADVA